MEGESHFCLPQSVAELHEQVINFLTVGLSSLGITATHLNEIAINSKEKKHPLTLVPAPQQRTESGDVVQGDVAIHCHCFSGFLNANTPEESAKIIARALSTKSHPIIEAVGSDEKGHLHIRIKIHPLATAAVCEWLKPRPKAPKGSLVIEFSSPNTNKPQHLGHVRNNCLGESMARIFKDAGHTVHKINLINDRGIHICKSMLAYKKFGGDKTPESEKIKGDHLVGQFYVMFENLFRDEYKAWLDSEAGKQEFNLWVASEAGKRDIKKQTELNAKTVKAIAQEKAQMEKKAKQREQERKKRKAERAKKQVSSEKVAEFEQKEKGKEEKDIQDEAMAQRNDEIKLQKLSGRIKDEKKLFEEFFVDTFFNTHSLLGGETKQMLVDWEKGDEEVRALWRKMNGWVIAGFNETYQTLGVSFDDIDLESNTYLSGKELVKEALANGILSQLPDGTIVCDLTKTEVPNAAKMKNPFKALLRSDGTSVYMTQDLGTAVQRFEKYNAEKMIYVVANEQNTHFVELFAILALIRPQLKDICHHRSYGMVYLPEGRMKSREGKIVDADDLVEEVTEMEEVATTKRCKELSAEEIHLRARKIALAAIKYLILSHHPDSTITFDPKISLQTNGNTGPYHLYGYARTRSILRKCGVQASDFDLTNKTPEEEQELVHSLQSLATERERQVLNQLCQLAVDRTFAVTSKDPAKIADSLFPLTKVFSLFFQEEVKKESEGGEDEEGKEKEKGEQKKRPKLRVHPISTCGDPELKKARLLLTCSVGEAIKKNLFLLGIDTLEAM